MQKKLILTFIYFIPLLVFSQKQDIPFLERNISICANGITPQSALSAISQQGGFVFSYSPSLLPVGNVSICIENQPVRLVLNTLFNGAIEYSIRGKYVILKKSLLSKSESKNIIEGYLIDSITGERIAYASIYDKGQMLSAITNKYGYFQIEIPKNTEVPKLYLSKQGYTDTTLTTSKGNKNFFNIKLISKKIFDASAITFGDIIKSPLTDSLKRKAWIPNWLLTQPIKAHVRNVSDTIFKHVQISFLPFISTNKLLTANTANDYSFNILAGYTQEVRKFEVGGILNIVRKDVKSVQLSGVGNIVGGTVRGVQAAGTFNIVRGDVGKVQLGGVFNIVGGSVKGLQMGGNFNVCNTFEGAQIAGLFNYTSKFDGAQIGGIWSEARVADGLQLSGIINTSKNFTGFQIAGISNITSSLDGTQIAGIVNVAKAVDGNQVAGILNVTTILDGYQFGLINIADSAKGVPFGFISFIKKGYHKLELSVDEMRVASLSYRTGVPLFHNNFSVGASTSSLGNPLWTLGYGLGTSIGFKSKYFWDFDISANKFVKDGNWSSENGLYKVYTGIDWKIAGKTSIAVGVSYNLLHTNTSETEFNSTLYELIPFTLSNSTSGNSNLKSWVGARVAIRFF